MMGNLMLVTKRYDFSTRGSYLSLCLSAATGTGNFDECSSENQLIIIIHEILFQFSYKKTLCRFTLFTEFLIRSSCFVVAAKRLALTVLSMEKQVNPGEPCAQTPRKMWC